MTTADDTTTDWSALDNAPAGPHLRPVGDDERPPAGRAEAVRLEGDKGAAKQHPDHVRWLRSRLGAGPLSWAFQRGPAVVRVTCIGEDGYVEPVQITDDNGPATVARLSGQELSTRLSDHYVFMVVKKVGSSFVEVEAWFPTGDADRALETADRLPHLRPLRGVCHTPILRAEGGMLTEPGYDEQTGFLYVPNGPVPNFPTRPTSDQVRDAVDRVRALVAEFSWAGAHDEANYLGAMITPLMRLVTPPPYKALAIGAHQRGSGKSLLAQVLRIVHGGTLRTWPATEEELGKQITAVLTQTTSPVCQFDNIRGLIRSGKLDALLTTRDITDRVLGSTNDTSMVNDRLWIMTGNNMVLGGDLDRRVVWTMIDPGVERPEDRTGFAIPNLGEHVERHRDAILGDLLTMLAAWDAAGRPTGEPTSDSFGTWVAAVRGIHEVCGVPGTFDHVDSRSETVDPDAEEAAAFLEAIEERFGVTAWTVKDVTAAMVDPGSNSWNDRAAEQIKRDDQGKALSETLPAGARGKAWREGYSKYRELTRPLGYYLRNREGQWFDGRRIVKASRDRNGVSYRVELAKRSGMAA